MENKRKCCFCSRDDAKYSCPRCNAVYCSKNCYQSPDHVVCSEQFYRECVEEELKLENADDNQKKHMLEILNRLHSEDPDDDILNDRDSDDEDSIPDLGERLQNIDLNDADQVWQCLTEEEKQEFRTILNDGDISQLIPEFEPWWCRRYDKKIEELESFLNKETEKQYKEICPPVAEIIPFSELSKVQPSPCILWNIVNVLASYSFTVRRYIGEHHDNQAVNTILGVCMNLTSDHNFESKETAIQSVVYHANNNTSITCSQEEVAMMTEDVNKLLAGPETSAVEFYMLAALSDLQVLLSNAVKTKKSVKPCGTEFSKRYPNPLEPVDKTKLRRCVKKLSFFMSWTNEFYSQHVLK